MFYNRAIFSFLFFIVISAFRFHFLSIFVFFIDYIPKGN